MDNDNKLKREAVKLYRKARMRLDYMGMGLLSEDAANERLYQMLQTDAPFMAGRFGAVEMHLVAKWMEGKAFSEQEADQAFYAAGIFPNDSDTLTKFCEVYTEAMPACDLLGVWEVAGEKKAILDYCNKPSLAPIRSLEPYYFTKPWSAALAGKKVLIVHPFTASIRTQLAHREEVWPGKDVLPEFGETSFLTAVQSNAGGKTEFSDWFCALEYMKDEMAKSDFDVAIIGAGAYGFPLAAYAKEIGKQAIQMSGATQILFGIKGKRWDHHPVISGFYNEAWIRPSKEETPPKTEKVEGGSYW